jgi:hypothetical protein
MTHYCRQHPDWQGLDMGKIHDHLTKDHAEELAEAKDGKEYFEKLRLIFHVEIFEIPGPNRLNDQQWINRFHGRPPKIGNLMGDNETEK